MGLKKWLSLSTSQAIGPHGKDDDDADDVVEAHAFAPSQSHPQQQQQQQQQQQRRQRLQQETPRRHTAWEAQPEKRRGRTQHVPTRCSVVRRARPTDAWDRTQRVCPTSMDGRHCPETDSMWSMHTALQSPPVAQLLEAEDDSDVSIGADDDDDDDDDDGFVLANVVAAAVPIGLWSRAREGLEKRDQSDTRRFSWKTVLSQAAKTDVGTTRVVPRGVELEISAPDAVSGTGSSTRTMAASSDQQARGKRALYNSDVALQPQDDEMGVVMHGWLEKCGQQFKTWKWRFFVLRNDGVLSYYTDESLKKLKGSIDVRCGSNADVSVQTNAMDKAFVFLIATSQRHLMISAPSKVMMSKWIARLHAAGAVPTDAWDPLNKTVTFYVHDTKMNHEWKRCDDPTSHIHMEGFLLKRGHVNKSWRNRFFRIEKGELRYYTENQNVLKGSVPLKDTIVSPGMAQCPDGRKNYFVLTSKDGKFEMHLNARDENSMHLWIEALQEAQTALSRMAGRKGTVAGLSLVLKRADEIPLGKISVLFRKPEDLNIEMQRRTEALIVAYSPNDCAVAVGSQLVSIEGRSILRKTYTEARKSLRASSFPLQLEFLLPPCKRGVLIKKSRSGFENWKKRVVVVANGAIRYYKQVLSQNEGKKAPAELKHRKSFSLYGCYLNLVQMPGREMCIVVARSPSDKLVLETRTEEERMEWASVIYCSIRMVSQGITSGLIENLQLEKPRRSSERAKAAGLESNLEDRTTQRKY
ncbi:unnamed protein product [Hyaloperonospora brassicae]|uniref:PH domain-containing protein n=1 Tax=Hyaloperonospora brassicae TaxID=162125 RepID=A0AAV0V130_HYABA|nr:unnamed protein product [Hyaloperonospora brassicae]